MNQNELSNLEKNHFENELAVSFWNQRWQSGQTGWDIGQVSPPIANYINHYQSKNANILIPGCGNAYEAEYLVSQGFQNITLLDIAPEAVSRLKEKFKSTPQVKVLCGDFFQHKGEYDLIIEQTFFCAQILERREEYVRQMSTLLNKGGKLVGVLFGIDMGISGPPFGGNLSDYQKLFQSLFQIKKMESCYNSIAPRAGTELFIHLIKKDN